ncbi:unnamed protein product [marine sediment metagenome]|uniref:Uncharacterized protein n=1 Tax=marine sediment metagenome TaxID=412755 RepID=X0TGZ1_9ZZZZ
MSLKDAHFHQVLSAAALSGTPLADQFDTTTYSDSVSMKKYNKAYFFVYWGAVSGAGTADLTILASDDAGVTTEHATAIPFRYKHITVPDTNAAWVAAATVKTSGVASGMCIIEVNAEDLPLVAGVKYEYCRLKSIEDDNYTKLGGIIIIMDEPRYAQDVSEVVTA